MFNSIDMSYIILVMPALLFSMWAQSMVTSSFKKYTKQPTSRGLTGAQAAEEVLRRSGATDVRVEKIPGHLTDHFDPRDNVIRLSDSVYNVPSIAAVGVAAHEAGHALQYQHGYFPMKVRSAVIPVTNFGSKLSMPLVLIGFAMGYPGLVNIGILLFCAVVFFQLVTLPVEFNASARAINILDESGLLTDEELPGAKKVLRAAAMTYVAALAVSLAQLLRLMMLSRSRRRN